MADAAARSSFATEPVNVDVNGQLPMELSGNMHRAHTLQYLHIGKPSPRVEDYCGFPITAHTLSRHDAAWPLMYDPLFVMANVSRGRLLAHECDLLDVFSTNPEARIQTSSPVNLSRIDCFTHNDLAWLIRTVRECLLTLEIEWAEVANISGTWFVARCSFMQGRVANTYYFSIALFKQSWRVGYGVDICPLGISAARLVQSRFGPRGVGYEQGVQHAEPKRIKKLIREYLKEAAKQLLRTRKDTVTSIPEQDGSDARSSTSRNLETVSQSPPVPARPRGRG
ncbi:hypothetical protein LTR85_004126 [Meristemomyces frigidus]|nr:hypothetical protein LTR85_004126 [Meristemomyces frigidus]